MSWRPATNSRTSKSFRLGAMRERINLQTATDAVDSAGQPIRSWANTYVNEPADFRPTIGGEFFRNRNIEANVTAVFTIHRRDSITPMMRVVHGSQTYGIVRVREVEGGRRYIELECKAEANG